MSELSDQLIAYGGRAPTELSENTKFHQELLDDLSREMAVRGWSGADFDAYRRSDGYVLIEIVPADEGVLTLERLAVFRQRQKDMREAEQMARAAQPEQRSMF
ncbi:hypothetical protein [Rhizobium sp. SGZ-381]|uniref:hypothetical protein n=1 Tax=Rhizobium sp. SGZ-381 TaxID=3342800 RepID=UPI0036731FF1